jgi:transcriptional regulator GlxA family with amidase domain
MAPKADVVMSVCTGAFLLAKTGLLDGRLATTHHDYYDSFAKKFPDVTLVRDVRYVENPGGKLCSAGGISSGIELALRVVERYFGGHSTAQTAYYMEYNRSSARPVAS